LEKQNKQYITKTEFDELRKDILTWSDIKNIINCADAMKKVQTSSIGLDACEIDNTTQENPSVIENVNEITESKLEPESKLDIENKSEQEQTDHKVDADILQHIVKKLPIPPQKILDQRKQLSENPEITVNHLPSNDVELFNNPTEEIRDVKFGDIEKLTLNIPDVVETKKLIATVYSNASEIKNNKKSKSRHHAHRKMKNSKLKNHVEPTIPPVETHDIKQLDLPNTYEIKELIQSESVPKKVDVPIPNVDDVKQLIKDTCIDVSENSGTVHIKKVFDVSVEHVVFDGSEINRAPTENTDAPEKINNPIEMVDLVSNECHDESGKINNPIEIVESEKIKNPIETVDLVSNECHDESGKINNPIEIVESKSNINLDAHLTVDDLIIKTVGEYETLCEYRRNMSHKNEKVMDLSKSVLNDDTSKVQQSQQILVPISTIPVNATKKRKHRFFKK